MALGVPPIRGRGIRVLAMDGGGMKGLALVDLLRAIEQRAGAPLWQLFDIVGGTSTGGRSGWRGWVRVRNAVASLAAGSFASLGPGP